MTDTTTLEAEIEEAIAELPAEEDHPVREVFKPHPGLMAGILVTTLSVIDDDPKVNETEVLFTAVKKFIQQTTRDGKPESIMSAVFAYYIESYRALQIMRKKAKEEDASADPQYVKLYNEAALSVFDLYLVIPRDGFARRMLPLATMALHEIVATYQASDESRPVKEVIGNLSTVALLSQTVGEYTKGSRRNKSFAYIRWLKDFYIKLLSGHDLSWMEHDQNLKLVLPQVSKSKNVIEVLPQVKH